MHFPLFGCLKIHLFSGVNRDKMVSREYSTPVVNGLEFLAFIRIIRGKYSAIIWHLHLITEETSRKLHLLANNTMYSPVNLSSHSYPSCDEHISHMHNYLEIHQHAEDDVCIENLI